MTKVVRVFPYPIPFSLTTMLLTSSSSGSSQNVAVCGRVWPSDQSSCVPCVSVHVPHGSPSSASSHGGPAENHGVYGATQCVRSEAGNRGKINRIII